MAAIVFSGTGSLSAAEFDASLSVVEFDVTLSEQHDVKVSPTDHPVEEGVDISDHVHVEKETVKLEVIITNTPINDMSSARFSMAGSTNPPKPVAPLSMRKLPITLEVPSFAQQGNGSSLKTSRQTQTAQIDGPNLVPWRLPGFRPDAPTDVTKLSVFNKNVNASVGGTSLQAMSPVDRVRAVYETLRSLCRSGVEIFLTTDLRDYPSMLLTDVSAPKEAMDAIRCSLSFEEVRFAETRVVDLAVKKVEEPRGETVVDVGHSDAVVAPEEDATIKNSHLDRLGGPGGKILEGLLN